LVALDLAGDEANWPGALFVRHFEKARDVGLQITIHAGEADGPQSIWQAIQGLGATRIGHAVAAIDDPLLMEHMALQQIAIESNLTSNVQTSTVPNYDSHPAHHFLERGLLVTLNTDDPGISAIDLRHEYEVAAPAAGLSREQIRQAQHNALEAAFLSKVDKKALLAAKQVARG
jgi:adenosine deaminase